MSISHAAIIPLIGGLPIGQAQAFTSQAHWMASYDAFVANDAQIRNYWNDVPYVSLSNGAPALSKVDVVAATCPCAGLSALSTTSSSNSSTNDWLYHSSEYVLEHVKPRVLWGENAPRLASNAGKPVVDRLRKIAAKYSYSFALYRTKTLLHGGHQIRDRSFYFFFDTPNSIPVLPYVDKRYEEDVASYIKSISYRSDDPMSQILASDNTPSHDPLYEYLLNVLEDGKTHRQFAQEITDTCYVQDHVEKYSDYAKIAEYLRERGHERYAAKCLRMKAKLDSGGNIMRRGLIVPKTHTGAFVGSMPCTLVHPEEDRFLTLREVLSMMYMPEDFQLLGGKANINMVCQNVPVKTAKSMAAMIRDYLEGKLDTLNVNFAVFDNKSKTTASETHSDIESFYTEKQSF